MESVLILDGNQRSALAATRSLGRRHVRVLVADQTERSMAGCSRFCAESFQYPSPRHEPDAFIATLAEECRKRRVDVLYPMSDISMYHVLENRHRLEGVIVPYASFESYERLTDKWRFFELAAQLGLSIPVTHFVKCAANLTSIARELRFPLVIKPYRSQLWSNGRWLHASVRYANTFDELASTVAKTEYLANQPFLLQEYIHGENQGIFALCDLGVPQVYFANRRVRDVPPVGGMAVVAESIPMNPKTRAIAERLLSAAGWHGVAMVECKIRDGTPYILETNARFWATTQLAVDCGVDYPWLLYQLATGRPRDAAGPYEEGRFLRNLLGDFEHYYMNLTGIGVNPYESAEERRCALRGFWRFRRARTYYEINRWNDLRPFRYELTRCAKSLHPARVLGHLLGRRGSESPASDLNAPSGPRVSAVVDPAHPPRDAATVGLPR